MTNEQEIRRLRRVIVSMLVVNKVTVADMARVFNMSSKAIYKLIKEIREIQSESETPVVDSNIVV